MKILHIINNLGSGGAEKLLEEALPIMNKKDNIEIEVLLLTDEGNKFSDNISKSIKVDVVPFRNIYNPLNILYIKKYIKNIRCDIVHSHLFPSNYWVSIAAKLLIKNKPKFILTEHSTHNRRREKKYFRPLEKDIYRSYSKIICISKDVRTNIIEWLNPNDKDLNKFEVIHNGIDIFKYKNAIPYNKSEINIKFSEYTKIICMVGRFSKAKDQATIIKSIKYLPKDYELILIGEGPLKKECLYLAKSINVEDRVHFCGFRNDVDRILKTCDIAIMSSNWEGFGLAAVEAMASGKPIIISNTPGLRNIVDNTEVTFNNGDYKTLSKIIIDLMNNKKKYEETVSRGFDKINRYSIDKMVENYIDLYKETLL